MVDQNTLVQRSDRIVGRLLSELGPTFSFSPVEPKLGVMFAFRERAPKGTFWADGQRDRAHFSPTAGQWVAILNTSPSDDVAKERLRLFMLERIDTSMPPSAPSKDDIDAIVAEKVAAAMAKFSADIAAGTARPDLIEKAVVREVRQETAADVGPVGLQVGPSSRRSTEPMTDDQSRNVGLWTERGRRLGMTPIKIKSDGEIDGRWLRNAKRTWALREAAGV